MSKAIKCTIDLISAARDYEAKRQRINYRKDVERSAKEADKIINALDKRAQLAEEERTKHVASSGKARQELIEAKAQYQHSLGEALLRAQNAESEAIKLEARLETIKQAAGHLKDEEITRLAEIVDVGRLVLAMPETSELWHVGGLSSNWAYNPCHGQPAKFGNSAREALIAGGFTAGEVSQCVDQCVSECQAPSICGTDGISMPDRITPDEIRALQAKAETACSHNKNLPCLYDGCHNGCKRFMASGEMFR